MKEYLARLTHRLGTNEFNLEARRAFASSLGLDALSFRIVETWGGHVLRCGTWTGTSEKSKASLSPTQESDLADFLFQHEGSNWRIRHEGRRLSRMTTGQTGSLWVDLLPFPFPLFEWASRPNQEWNLILEPADFQTAIAEFHSAITALETKLSSTEVSLLYVAGKTVDFAALFHYVRRKRLKATSDPELLGRARRFAGEPALSASLLSEEFGTHSSFIAIDLRSEQGCPLAAASLAIRSAMAATIVHTPAQSSLSAEIRL